ncbi:MAG TPA: hypothetical protein PLM33_12780, partial [Acidobacteriota bacterium]|nr:hypothetical protein [Acidobacteriota bacterium]
RQNVLLIDLDPQGNATMGSGIDKRELARDHHAIQVELEAKIPPMLDQGGYIPTLDHTVPPDVPYDNFLYYLELKKQMIGRA